MEELEPQAEGESPDAAPDTPEPPAVPAPDSEIVPAETEAAPAESEAVTAEELLAGGAAPEPEPPAEDVHMRAVLEALVYVTEEPLNIPQIAGALQQSEERIRTILAELVAEFDKPGHGIHIKEVAGGYKMATKPEHHEAVRSFVKSLKPPLKLSLPALETLAVIAYKQPVTGPEIMEIRGVQGAGVLKTLLDRKLIAAAGRKNVIGKPILYKTTREFLLQFGLKDLAELPSLKEFEEIRRMAFSDEPQPGAREAAGATAQPAPTPTGDGDGAEPPAEVATPEAAAETADAEASPPESGGEAQPPAAAAAEPVTSEMPQPSGGGEGQTPSAKISDAEAPPPEARGEAQPPADAGAEPVTGEIPQPPGGGERQTPSNSVPPAPAETADAEAQPLAAAENSLAEAGGEEQTPPSEAATESAAEAALTGLPAEDAESGESLERDPATRPENR
jgi:segregation and condensation protein B